ncbi:hypothetical protein XI07_15815 [Bradyrhizobium sp. CCBAU 11445]|uniref:hypothetical protein n=1 Tax=unclassified Bradyrhizobium TaxID=2631580 RepID=UPI0023055125|nr:MULTISPECIES: hypothetical protein [unclassified Bradyrhizobium]MDA9483450.1 hypothetical protein [Bradyrhizobium sp. CCBAU 11445]
MASEWRKEQARRLQEIGWQEAAEQSYMDGGVALLTNAKDSQQISTSLRRTNVAFLNFVLSNSYWRDGELTATFRQPFDLLKN